VVLDFTHLACVGQVGHSPSCNFVGHFAATFGSFCASVRCAEIGTKRPRFSLRDSNSKPLFCQCPHVLRLSPRLLCALINSGFFFFKHILYISHIAFLYFFHVVRFCVPLSYISILYKIHSFRERWLCFVYLFRARKMRE
jgi:hypothetical protein